MNRTENDSLGSKQIPAEALYGIHSIRAKENFPSDIVFHQEWYRAIGLTKLACYRTYKKFRSATLEKYGESLPINIIAEEKINALEKSAEEVSEGLYFSHFIVPAIQGGAGTSINMNINEIITNAALLELDKETGSYDILDPIEDANIYQSTNDVIPTALTIAAMGLLKDLEEKINSLRQIIEKKESENRNKLRPAYTQMQEAVPSTIGALFSTYNEALSRDWWRVSKCKERIKVVNLGGGASGTGIAIPRFFIMEVVPELRSITSLPVSRSENLQDATSNLDSWVEIHAMLKAHAVNLEKIANDIRLLSSDISSKGFIQLPERQVGSSIMPGKTNPVIPEFVISSTQKIFSNDLLISSLCAQGCLDLNAYLPTIGHAILESLKLLIAVNHSLAINLFEDIEVDTEAAYKALINSPSITTALTPYIGYNKAALIAKEMKDSKMDIFQASSKTGLIPEEKLKKILDPSMLIKLGFTLSDIAE
ncbi:MAG: lyase family protein [Bacteroidales bacterium]|nr:lyase family protein [Bacteroidales bacterium]